MRSKAPAAAHRRAVTASELEDALHSLGMKRSAARTAILEAFAACTDHVSAEELTALVRQRLPGVSPSTVYRTLNVLVGADLATARAFGDGHTRFELAHAEHHDHLICTLCGRVVEFQNDEIERLQAAVARTQGFEIATHKLELYGTCAGCRTRALSRNGSPGWLGVGGARTALPAGRGSPAPPGTRRRRPRSAS